MRLRKIALLLLILGFGATVETAWSVRDRVGFGPLGCRVLAGRFYGPSFTFESEELRPVPAGTALEIQNAFGGVHVSQGAPGEVRVRLRKVVFQATEPEARTFADGIQLQVQLDGGTLHVGTNRTALESASRVGFETHLEVSLPPDTALTVRNDHGAVEATDVASADLLSSFDSVRAARVAGPAVLSNRHGDLAVSEVKGAVSLTGRHGDVDVHDVQGPVTVELEHGDVVAARVGGLAVQLAHGDVRAATVNGDLSLRGQHAGLSVSGVSGQATLQTSFRDLELENVAGEARARAEHGSIEVKEAKGAVFAQASFGNVTLSAVTGPVEAVVTHGGVTGEGLLGGARVRATGDTVSLSRFAGAVEVQADRGSVRLAPEGPLLAPLSVTTRHGGIHLEVPVGSRFDLDAATTAGEVEAEVTGLTVRSDEARHLTATLGGGGNPVMLRADHGDVRLENTTSMAEGQR